MAIDAVDHRGHGHGRLEAWNVSIEARRDNRVKRGGGWVKLEPRVCLRDLPGDRGLNPARIVGVTFEAIISSLRLRAEAHLRLQAYLKSPMI